MNMNIVSLKVEANENSIIIHPVNTEMIKKAQETGKSYYANPDSIYLSYPEVEYIIRCLFNRADFSPYLDDGIFVTKFGPQGFKLIRLHHHHSGNGTFETYYFNMPGYYLAGILEEALVEGPKHSVDDEKWEDEVSPNELYSLKCLHAPRIALDAEDSVKERLAQDLNDNRQTGLFEALSHPVRIARNRSFGDKIVVHLYFDWRPEEDKPASYYWDIRDSNNERIMNGGIIAHKRDENSWEYSTHT